MKLNRCPSLTLRPHDGFWFRALSLKYWPRRLMTDHTRTTNSRFSPGSLATPAFRSLYLGSDHQVVLFELRRLLGSVATPVPDPRGSYALLSLDVRLDHVADLCDLDQQRLIGTNRQELTGNWVNHGSIAPTQALGMALDNVPNLEGLIFPSSMTEGKNLLIFPDKLCTNSYIKFYNEINNKLEKIL